LLFAFLLLLVLPTAGCYHLRLAPVPLETFRFTVAKPRERVFTVIEALLQADGFALRSRERDQSGLETEFRFFFKETGEYQPAEGRDYYYRLRVTLTESSAGTTVTMEPSALELRSHYVFDEGGGISTLTKRYPYENYPSMFDLDRVTGEVRRIGEICRRTLL
jgi:hypothetical protein